MTHADAAAIRLALPHHLRNLAGVGKELALSVPRTAGGDVTLEGVVAALEARFPMLRGTLRDPTSGGRRAYVRFFACRRDLSHEGMNTALPREVAEGEEVLIVMGAMSGG